jgi:polyisoprenoid-binding protein YceI
MRKIIGAVLAVAVVAVGGFLVWFFVIKDDAPDRLGQSDLDAALATTTVVVGTAPATTPPPDTAVAITDAPGEGTPAGDVTGTWVISIDSTVGYRATEVLAGLETEGVGRTDAVTGTMIIDGTVVQSAAFEVDMTTITSDSDRRDNQFQGRIMTTDQFPTATFVLTEPIDVGSIPSEGETVTVTATGDLTLRGVTRPVTFEMTAQIEGGRIGVLGSIPILFSDYQIPDPSNSFAQVEDNGLLEFVLVFDPA